MIIPFNFCASLAEEVGFNKELAQMNAYFDTALEFENAGEHSLAAGCLIIAVAIEKNNSWPN